MEIGFLDDRGQRLLGHPPRLQESREVASSSELGDAPLDRAGARLPVALAIAVALGDPIGAALAVPGAGQPFDFQLHQPLRGKADHLAQQVGVGALLHKRAKGDHLIGHPRIEFGERVLRQVDRFDDPTLPKRSAMTTAVDK